MPCNSFLIFIPTYNEIENVEILYKQIKGLNLDTDILFLDDNSPDGTGKLIDKIIHRDATVFVIHRKEKSGIGSAHQDGIRWAYKKEYKYLITMDCDFSHSPTYIADFMRYAPEYDIVVGSRYMQEKSLLGWSKLRKMLTTLGHFFTNKLLGIPYDATGAFRCYALERIPQSLFGLIQSKGYSFFFESLYALNLNRYSVKEFSINLPARTYGHSKMRLRDVIQSFLRLITTYLQSMIRRSTYLQSSLINKSKEV